ncbi:hypothetical protein [Streptomyces werraensis]|uniref:hypothetical protein n=1 Tax=Streptomyces werraensis TaxID=68284 RepID=UPI00343D79CF
MPGQSVKDLLHRLVNKTRKDDNRKAAVEQRTPTLPDQTATSPLVDSNSASPCSSHAEDRLGGGPSHTSTISVTVWVWPPL